jgi:hypothetical protein
MAGPCPNPYCVVADGGGCHLGNLDPADCPDLAKAKTPEGSEATQDQQVLAGQVVFPWSSNALNALDLPFVASRGQPIVVGLFGPHNAGKTTLLAALYLQLGAGKRPKSGHRFAGSYTLAGWEALAHALRWSNDQPPSFPAHTPAGIRREPGLLHLALREDNGGLADTFFADAPGEWFDSWAHDRDAASAVSARWLATRSSVLLLVADCEALAGAGQGNARKIMRLLAERLAEAQDGRPVALVWTKADIEPPELIAATVREAAHAVLSNLAEFQVTVAPKNRKDPGFMALLTWILTAQTAPYRTPLRAAAVADPFLVYGR